MTEAEAEFPENTQIHIREPDGEVTYVRYIREDEVDPDGGYDWYDHDYDYDYDYDYYDTGYDDGYGYDYGYDYDYDYDYEYPFGRAGRTDRERERDRERQQAEQEEAEVEEYRRKMKELARDQRQAAANREWLIRNYGS